MKNTKRINKKSRKGGKKGLVGTLNLPNPRARLTLGRTIEFKTVFNTDNNNTAISAGLVYPLTLVGQGTSDQQRIGDVITVHTITLHVETIFNTLGPAHQPLRCLMFVDTMNVGATPLASDILQTTGSGLVMVSPFAHSTVFVQKRYIILGDFTTNVSQTGSQSSIKKLQYDGRIDTTFIGTTNTAASLGKNSIFAVIFSDAGANGALYNLYSKVLYTDS